MKEKTYYSKKILSSNREFLLDVKKNSAGTPYLKITQIIKSESKNSSQSIFLFKEDSKCFIECIQTALSKFSDAPYHHSIPHKELRNSNKNPDKPWKEYEFDSLEQPEHCIPLEELRKSYKNARKPWSESDDETLEQLYYAKESMKEMCITLGRTFGEIEIRINVLGLDDKYGI